MASRAERHESRRHPPTEKSQSSQGGDGDSGSAFSFALVGGLVCAVGIAIAAWIALGPLFIIPVVLVTITLLAFSGIHRTLGFVKTRGKDEGAHDRFVEDGSDPVPHLGFDEQTALGDTGERSDERPYEPLKSPGS
jgi:hypothetical protein